MVSVVVPDGVDANQTFTVDFDGRCFDVKLPEGLNAGDLLEVSLPLGTASDDDALYAVGSRVKCCRSNGSWLEATVVEHDSTSGTYTVRCEPGGALKYFVEENDLAPPTFTPTPCGEHYEGRKVQVRGADGRWEEALVRAYDAASRSYAVEPLGAGGVRTGVQLSEIRLRQRL